MIIESVDSMIGRMHVINIRQRTSLERRISILTPHEYYMILPALAISVVHVVKHQSVLINTYKRPENDAGFPKHNSQLLKLHLLFISL